MKSAEKTFTHVDESGQPSMVDVSGKDSTVRTAVARGTIQLPDDALEHLKENELNSKKGPVFQTAILAGIQGAKETSRLIPLCHPLPLEDCRVTISMEKPPEAVIECICRTTGKTGVEMEALTGVSIAALTLYDMCKSFSHEMVLKDIHLVHKAGGRRTVGTPIS